MSSYTFNLSNAWPATNAEGQYHSTLRLLQGREVSGVYVIIDRRTRAVLYVGESHTGRLYDTITRHFREWRVGPGDAQGRRRGGVMYDREAVAVVYVTTKAGEAADLQYAAIQDLNPRDNTIKGGTVVDVPF